MGVYLREKIYYIDYHANGKRIRKPIGSSKKLAETVLQKNLVEVAEGKHLDVQKQEKIKFNNFAQEFEELHAKGKKSWKSGFRNSLRRLVPFFGSRYLYEIDVMMVEKYKLERRKLVSAATVNRELACLKTMFNKAIDWGKAKENPVKKVKLFKENNQRVRYLEEEELVRLLDNCPLQLRVIVLVAVHTGMRKSELQYLKWTDLDFQKDIITLRETKNDETRHIPMTKTVKEVLLGIRKHPDSPYIFCNKDGRPYDFRKSFETAIKKSDILDFRFHDLRHTFASRLLMRGVDLNTVREYLGHKSLDMTLRYAHLSKDHKARAIQVLDDEIVTNRSQDQKNGEREKITDSVSSLKLAS